MKKKDVSLTYDDFEKFIFWLPKIQPFVSKTGRPPLSKDAFILLYKLMFFCALRVNEVAKLKKSDINLKEKEIKIPVTFINLLDKTTITPNIIGDLGNYIKDFDDNDYIFVSNALNSKSPFVNRELLWKYAKQAGDLAGIQLFRLSVKKSFEGLSTLLFREAYKNFMLKNDAIENLVELKLRSKTTNKYGNYDINDLKNWEKRIFKQTLSEEEIHEHSNWYTNEYDTYKKLAEKIKELLIEMLQSRKIPYHYIDARPKEISDFEMKLRIGITYNPKNMQDLAGIRVICYVKTDVENVCKILENKDNFEIDYNRSHDRSKILGEDKMGYSSIHYVAKLSESRTRHEENKRYVGKFFEIQVRTILQHAWAEIQHDEMYKNSEKLDAELKRRFYLVSSILETADNEFNTLHQKWKKE